MQFAIIARDANDAEALSRRMAVREAHLRGACHLKRQGNLIEGGAILNESGNLCGSVMFCEFDSRADLEAWLASEIYVTHKVWDKIEILSIRLPPWQKLSEEYDI